MKNNLKNKYDHYHYVLMKGNLYISRINIDDCDNEIKISFTSIIDNAKKFDDLNYLTFKDLVELLLNCNIDVVAVKD